MLETGFAKGFSGHILDCRLYSKVHIALKREYISDFFNENRVILYKLLDKPEIISISKICKIKHRTSISYILSLKKEAIDKAKIKPPCDIKIEVLGSKPISWKPEIENRSEMIDIISLIKMDENFTCFENGNDSITLYYLSGSKPSIFTSPRFMKLDDFCFWNLGLYLAEGLKLNKNRVSISNCDESIVRRFVDYLKTCWRIKDEQIYIYIKISSKNYSDTVKTFWSKALGLNESKIRVNVIRNKPPTSENGGAEIVVYNTAFGIVFSNLLQNIRALLDRKDRISAFIKGVEDGDGWAIKHNKSIEIGIVAENKYVGLIEYCYTQLYGKPIIEDYWTTDKVKKIIYRGTKHAIEVLLNDHFIEHRYRRGNLVQLLKYYLRRDLKYLNRLKARGMSIKDLSGEIGVTYRSVDEIFDKFYNLDLIRYTQGIYGSNVNTREYKTKIFELTERGQKLLKCLGQ